jgi:hypothetical protein
MLVPNFTGVGTPFSLGEMRRQRFVHFRSAVLDRLHRRVRKQCNLTSPFDGQRQLPLVFSAVSRYAPRDDLAAFGHEVAQSLGILVIDTELTIHTEAADFPPMKSSSFASNDHLVSP